MVNNDVLRTTVGIIIIAIGIIMIPILLTGAWEIVTDPQADSFTGVVDSGTPTYSANVTLTQDLYDDATSNITAVTSSSGTDTPVASSYNSTTQALTVTGLNAGAPGTASRTLNVTYDYNAVNTFTGLENTTLIAPLIIFTFFIFGGVYAVIGVPVRRRYIRNKTRRRASSYR